MALIYPLGQSHFVVNRSDHIVKFTLNGLKGYKDATRQVGFLALPHCSDPIAPTKLSMLFVNIAKVESEGLSATSADHF